MVRAHVREGVPVPVYLRLWLHSQLIDEDVGHPDALYREGDLRQIVEVSWVPLEEFICPVLGTMERGLGG